MKKRKVKGKGLLACVLAAAEERKEEKELGYTLGVIDVVIDRDKADLEAKKRGMESEFELYIDVLKVYGDVSCTEDYSTNEIRMVRIEVNENKSTATAVKQYEVLPFVQSAELIFKRDPIIEFPSLHGIYPVYNEDSVDLGCVYNGFLNNTVFRWEYCVIGENDWHLISNWKKNEWCTWYPDANENYAVVCRVLFLGNEDIERQFVWYVSRPQMKKRITGKCAMQTKDGLLFGCTSTVGKNDKDYYTTCYIWSDREQAWITQASWNLSADSYVVVNHNSSGKAELLRISGHSIASRWAGDLLAFYFHTGSAVNTQTCLNCYSESSDRNIF